MNQHQRKENPEGRWRAFDYDELLKRDKVNLDLLWLKDADELLPPDVLAQEIIEHLEAALASFRDVAAGLQRS